MVLAFFYWLGVYCASWSACEGDRLGYAACIFCMRVAFAGSAFAKATGSVYGTSELRSPKS